jgi:hypothetical protein
VTTDFVFSWRRDIVFSFRNVQSKLRRTNLSLTRNEHTITVEISQFGLKVGYHHLLNTNYRVRVAEQYTHALSILIMNIKYKVWILFDHDSPAITHTYTTQNDNGACCHLMATLKNYNTVKWKTKLLHISNYEHNIPHAINKTSANKGRCYH